VGLVALGTGGCGGFGDCIDPCGSCMVATIEACLCLLVFGALKAIRLCWKEINYIFLIILIWHVF